MECGRVYNRPSATAGYATVNTRFSIEYCPPRQAYSCTGGDYSVAVGRAVLDIDRAGDCATSTCANNGDGGTAGTGASGSCPTLPRCRRNLQPATGRHTHCAQEIDFAVRREACGGRFRGNNHIKAATPSACAYHRRRSPAATLGTATA